MFSCLAVTLITNVGVLMFRIFYLKHFVAVGEIRFPTWLCEVGFVVLLLQGLQVQRSTVIRTSLCIRLCTLTLTL